MNKKLLLTVAVIFMLLPCVANAQENSVRLYGVEVDGDNIIVTSTEGDVTLTKVHNHVTNRYEWSFSSTERQKWSSELIEGISNALIQHFDSLDETLREEMQLLRSDLASIRLEDEEKRDVLETTLQNTMDSLIVSDREKGTIIEVLNAKITQIEQDRAEWGYAFIPGVRQFRLGYKKSAYTYWGLCGAAAVSAGVGLLYNAEYHRVVREINDQNRPPDDLYTRMDRAECNRNGWYTASVVIAGSTYVINLIDALMFSNRRKVVPENIGVAPVATAQYSGIALSYKF